MKMKSFIFDEETEILLKTRGLKCVCQLCDCGRPHRHQGCRKALPSVAMAIRNDGSRSNKVMTDYQARFGNFHCATPVEPIRPQQRPRDPNPPPMDLRTENQTAFKVFENVDRMKPCKLKGEIEKLSSGHHQFNACSVYKDSYHGHKIEQVALVPPSNSFKPSESRTFHTETEYHKNFPKKEKIQQRAYQEKPALSYNLMYPDSEKIPQKSFKNSIHNGQLGEKAKMFVPRKDNVELGTDDFGEVTTTNKAFFKPYTLAPVKSMKPQQKYMKRGQFSATTQNKLDFDYNENEARQAKQGLCPEHPSLINLSMDAPLDFKTVKMMSYNSVPDIKKTAMVKSGDRYTPPKDKFEAKTTNQVDFQGFGAQPRVETLRPSVGRVSSAKFANDSSYSTQYKNPGKISRVLYDAQYEDNLRLPPKSEKFNKTSVMQNDFQNRLKKAEKAQPFKPVYQLHQPTSEPFMSTTHYNEFYKTNEMQKCAFIEHLTKNKAMGTIIS